LNLNATIIKENKTAYRSIVTITVQTFIDKRTTVKAAATAGALVRLVPWYQRCHEERRKTKYLFNQNLLWKTDANEIGGFDRLLVKTILVS
jgi:hypothetical protein